MGASARGAGGAGMARAGEHLVGAALRGLRLMREVQVRVRARRGAIPPPVRLEFTASSSSGSPCGAYT